MSWKDSIMKGVEIVQDKTNEAKKLVEESGVLDKVKDKVSEASSIVSDKSKSTYSNLTETTINGEQAISGNITFDDSSNFEITNKQFKVIDEFNYGNVQFEIIEFEKLSGSNNGILSKELYYTSKTGMKLRFVKAKLKDSSIVMEGGLLDYMIGDIESESNIGDASEIAKKIAQKVLVKENAFKPTYKGTGELYLVPSFGHYLVVPVNNEVIIVDKGMFYCCTGDVEVGISMQKNISSALFGGEGLFQTKIKGTGVCILSSPVPMDEISIVTINNNKICVDGSHALLRKGNVNFSVEKSTKNFIGAITSGEGMLQTFQGTGEVWVAPTLPIYEHFKLQLGPERTKQFIK